MIIIPNILIFTPVNKHKVRKFVKTKVKKY